MRSFHMDLKFDQIRMALNRVHGHSSEVTRNFPKSYSQMHTALADAEDADIRAKLGAGKRVRFDLLGCGAASITVGA